VHDRDHVMSRPLVIVSGAMANKHLNGGEAWVRLNWLLGLRALGCDVCFVEQIRSGACVDEAGHPASFQESANLRYFHDVMHAFGLDDRSSLLCDDGREAHGLSLKEVVDAAGAAEALINISGHLKVEAVLRAVRRKAYIDLDPGFTQIWHAQGLEGAGLGGHDLYFTVGENVGTRECAIPTCGLEWKPKRRFLVLDQWPACPKASDRDRLTTVAAWRGDFGRVEHDGRTFGLKVHEFRKLLPLPARAPQTFEIALSIHPEDHGDLEALRAHGWRVADPREAAGDPFAFRRYLQQSGGEG
jgi:hypothetical protein